jgi:hypothetical protein
MRHRPLLQASPPSGATRWPERGKPARRRLGGTVALAVLGVAVGLALPAAAGARIEKRTVATKLDNPRGLVVLPTGELVVAEAGHAGTACLAPGFCAGLTGRVTMIEPGHRRHVPLVAGLPSVGGAFATFGLGGLALQRGQLFFVTGLNPQTFGDPSAPCQGQPNAASCAATLAAVQRGSGLLRRVRSLRDNRGARTVASVGRFDFDWAAAHPDPGNPEYAPGDANPFGLAPHPGHGFYVIDAASNTLDLVTPSGSVSVLAFVPDPVNHLPIYDAAPTCAALRADGDVIIGTESNSVWRWDGEHLTQALGGGKVGQVVGCVADRRGNVYLLNLSSKIGGGFPDFDVKPSDGSIVKVTPNLKTSYVVKGLNYPTGITLGPDGAFYIAVNGLCPRKLSRVTGDLAKTCPEPGKVVRLSRSGR